MKTLNSFACRSVSAFFASLFFILIFNAAMQAATFTVTTIGDSGAGSLRDAVNQANAATTDDTIIFNIPASSCNQTTGVCTITLASEITISNNGSLTINGTGANRLKIDGGAGTNRVFYSLYSATFTLRGLTLTGGNGVGADGTNYGGAIFFVGGTLTISNVYFYANTSGNVGGAVYFNAGTNHRIENSTFAGNSASSGGAIGVSNANLTVVNSTLNSNSASGYYGGGIYATGTGTLTLRGNTITNNTAYYGGGGLCSNATLDIGNNIIAGNSDSNGYPEIRLASGTFVVSQGFNLVGDSAGDSTNTETPISYKATDIQNTPPQLAPLAYNGGIIPTRALCTAANVPSSVCTGASPAIDKGSNALAGSLTLDARGVVRYDDVNKTNASFNAADIGAYELIATKITGWGFNGSGQIGDGTTTSRSFPTQIVGGFSDIVAIEGGEYHALGLRSNGTVLAWGNNIYGQLGDGTTTERHTPVAVSGLTNVVATAGGLYHSLALLSDGTIRAWGFNNSGQLGDGTTTNRTTPVIVSGITNAIAISAGEVSSYALLADGSVKAWGTNSEGQLGDGTMTQRTTPVQVSGLTGGVVAIEAGGFSAYAIKSSGSLVAWGRNVSGQIGDGTTTQRNTPVQVLGLTSGVVQVAGGYWHAAALKADGTLLTWGDDLFGELGDGTAGGYSATPTAISLGNVVQIKTNISFTTAARISNGKIFAWGDNSDGQMGNGTIITTYPHASRGSKKICVNGSNQHLFLMEDFRCQLPMKF